jgi:hypothetical protein
MICTFAAREAESNCTDMSAGVLSVIDGSSNSANSLTAAAGFTPSTAAEPVHLCYCFDSIDQSLPARRVSGVQLLQVLPSNTVWMRRPLALVGLVKIIGKRCSICTFPLRTSTAL